MITTELLEKDAVLIVTPKDKLEADDFIKLADKVDPYIDANGPLHGLMIYVESFPGWQDFAALLSHLKFVKDHHYRIEKVAAVSDSGFLTILPSIADHFVNAEVRHFDYDKKDEAMEWLIG
jgi:SpoIIAA-like